MARLVCALFQNEQQAHDVVHDLLAGGLDPGVISVVMHADDIRHEDVEDRGTKQRERAIEGGLIAGTLGAIVGGLIAGPLGLVGAGPAALALFAIGGAYGSLAGALSGRDAEQNQLAELREQVQQGRLLVMAEVNGPETVATIQRTLEERGGQRITVI